MSICGESRSLATLAVLGASLGLTACFNVKQVEVTGAAPLLLDDFEDGDQESSSQEFQGWGCYAWQKAAKPPTCVTTAPGFNSQRAEAFTFELSAPLDVRLNDTVGVELGLFPKLPEDLSAWTVVKFDAKFQPSPSRSAAEDLQRGVDGTTLWVRLKCDGGVDHSAGSYPGGFQVEQPVHVGIDWSSVSIPLALFQQPDWQKILVHLADCVANVDGLVFGSQLVDDRPDLVDGQSGTLTLDNVSLE
jgi:hypothetical protein